MDTELLPPRTPRRPRTYRVRTYGCQMNVHDSERLAGLLEERRLRAGRRRRRRRRRRPQHLRRPGERRQPALRQPRPPAPGEGRAAPACRSPSAAAWRRRTAARSSAARPWVDVVFGTHNVGLAAGAARARPAQRRGAGRDRRGARGLPVVAAGQARLRLLRLGVDQRRLQQHLHVLHRPVAARQGEGPPARRDPRRGAGAGRPGRPRGDAARPERERLRRRVRRARRLRRPAARRRPDRGPGAHPVHQPAPARVHRRRHRRDGRDAGGLPPAAHAAAVRVRRRAAPDAPRLPAATATSASSTGCGPPCPTPRSPPTSSSASRARPRRTSSRPSTSCAQARFASAFTFQYSKRPGTPAAEMDGQLPKAVVQERYERLTALQDEISWAENRALVGRRVELLVAAGRGQQGRPHRPAERPGPGRPARALHRRRTASGPATSSRPS